MTATCRPGWPRTAARRPCGREPGPWRGSLDRALSGQALEPLLPPPNRVSGGARKPISWIPTASRLSRTRAQSPFQNTCAEICRAHPDLQFLITRKKASMSTSIAVIDDDAACRELLHDLLSEEGYAVHLFADRRTAARCLRDLAPAAIILDVRLETPTAGWEVLADLRHDHVLHATPVLICSADLSALQERASDLERQGCAILAKPFDVDDLLVLLQHLTRGARQASPATTGAGRCTPVCAGG
jgi:CheY-like chemotaxis protein